MEGNYMSEENVGTEGEILEGKEKVKVMIESLKSSQLFVRVSGTEQLTLDGIENPGLALPIMIKELENKDWWTVRFGIVEAIQEISLRGSPVKDNYIAEMVKYLTDEDEDFRAKVADCLGDLNSKFPVPNLISTLEDNHEEAREMAAKALGKLGDESAVEKLVSLVDNDSSDYVVTSAIEALGKILKGKKKFSHISSIIRKMDVTIESVHRSAALAIGNVGDIEGVLPLIKLLNPSRKDTSPEGREDILKALQMFSEEEILKALLQASNDDDNILLDLIQEAIFHYPFELLIKESQLRKEKLISKNKRQFRRVKTEIDGINGFVADMFKSLANINDQEELQTLLETIPRKRKALDRIDLDQIAKYNWVKKELYENLKEAQEWYKLGHGALNELESAINQKISFISTK